MRVQRIIQPGELPQVESIPGEPKHPATPDDLLQMGYFVLGVLPAGVVVPLPDGGTLTTDERALLVDDAEYRPELHAGRLGTAIGKPALLVDRYRNLPVGSVKQLGHRAIVYRATDGSNLRAQCNAAVGAALEARRPAGARGRSQPPADPVAALDVLAEARSRASGETPTARRLEVAMNAIDDGDVVEEDGIRAGGWAGEAPE